MYQVTKTQWTIHRRCSRRWSPVRPRWRSNSPPPAPCPRPLPGPSGSWQMTWGGGLETMQKPSKKNIPIHAAQGANHDPPHQEPSVPGFHAHVARGETRYLAGLGSLENCGKLWFDAGSPKHSVLAASKSRHDPWRAWGSYSAPWNRSAVDLSTDCTRMAQGWDYPCLLINQPFKLMGLCLADLQLTLTL